MNICIKMDSALINLQRLICHKTYTNKQTDPQMCIFCVYVFSHVSTLIYIYIYIHHRFDRLQRNKERKEREQGQLIKSPGIIRLLEGNLLEEILKKIQKSRRKIEDGTKWNNGAKIKWWKLLSRIHSYIYTLAYWVEYQWSWRLGFKSRSIHTKDWKKVLDTSLLNMQCYKVRIKVK